MIKCPDCGLIIAPDKMKMHKDSGECTVKQYSDIFRRDQK
jgi:hypothetical protein